MTTMTSQEYEGHLKILRTLSDAPLVHMAQRQEYNVPPNEVRRVRFPKGAIACEVVDYRDKEPRYYMVFVGEMAESQWMRDHGFGREALRKMKGKHFRNVAAALAVVLGLLVGAQPADATVIDQVQIEWAEPQEIDILTMLGLVALGMDADAVQSAVNGLSPDPSNPDFVRVTLVSEHFTAVPEPGTAALLGLGLTGLLVAGRRRPGA